MDQDFLSDKRVVILLVMVGFIGVVCLYLGLVQDGGDFFRIFGALFTVTSIAIPGTVWLRRKFPPADETVQKNSERIHQAQERLRYIADSSGSMISENAGAVKKFKDKRAIKKTARMKKWVEDREAKSGDTTTEDSES